MERNLSRPLPRIPNERHEYNSNVAESSLIQQNGQEQRGHSTQPNAAHVQQPRISNRVSRQQFQNSVMLLHHDMDAQHDSSRQHTAAGLQTGTETKTSGPPPRSHQQLYVNNIPSQTSTNLANPEKTESEDTSAGVSQESSRQSYVEKQREAEQVHTKADPGDISSRIQSQASQGGHKGKSAIFKGRGDSDQPYRPRDLIRRVLFRKNQRKADLENEPPFYFQNEQGLVPQPNWPFGVHSRSSRNNDSGRVQLEPLTQREIRLLLRNPLIRNGNMGPLPTPDGVTPPRPPPHVFGTTSRPERAGWGPQLPIRRLTGLKRRNAQRRRPKSRMQQDFESFDDQFNARFRRGSVARDVREKYCSPVELARYNSVMVRIDEVSESSDSESVHTSAPEEAITSDTPEVNFNVETLPDNHQHQGGETGARQKDKSPRNPPPTTDEQDASSGQKTQRRSGSNKSTGTGSHRSPMLRRLPLVVRGPRPDPASLSASSSAPYPSQSSPPMTATTQTSTPASDTEPESKSEPQFDHLAQDEPGCGRPGCTRAACSRLRGTFRMPVPGGTRSESKSHEGGSGSAVEERSEDDIVSVGNGLSFLRLN